jgi:hypothetical protein
MKGGIHRIDCVQTADIWSHRILHFIAVVAFKALFFFGDPDMAVGFDQTRYDPAIRRVYDLGQFVWIRLDLPSYFINFTVLDQQAARIVGCPCHRQNLAVFYQYHILVSF